MANELYFIRILQEALQSPEPEPALGRALDEIERLGAQDAYRSGFENFQQFMEEVWSCHNLMRSDWARELIVELATEGSELGPEQRQAAMKAIDSSPQWQSEYEQLRGQLGQESGQDLSPMIQVYRDGNRVGEMILNEAGASESLGQIIPGAYLLKLGTGLVLWEGEMAGQRVQFVGTVEFARSVQRHVCDTIVPIVDRILKELAVPTGPFEVSAANLGAASALDVGTSVSGFSADVPVFLALLSAGLDLPLPDDLVSTGHIASVEGDIAAVKALPAKVQAALAGASIGRFVCPDLDKDTSLGVLSPQERDHSVEAIQEARDSLHIRSVGGIAELVREVFTEEAIVQASLKTGFFLILKHRPRCENPLPNAVHFLANNRRRFWRVLEQLLMAGKADRARELLRAFAQFHADRHLYPSHFGHRLLRLLCSLPPAVWRPIRVPMIDFALCVEAAKWARARDGEDVFALFDAVRAKHIERPVEPYPAGSPPEPAPSDSEGIAFRAITSQITERTIAQRVGILHDEARLRYPLQSNTVDSFDQFRTITADYYNYHFTACVSHGGRLSPGEAYTRAKEVLEREYRRRRGDIVSAFNDAHAGTNGGMRVTLDILAESLKAEAVERYITDAFDRYVAPNSWEQKVEIIRQFMAACGYLLSSSIATSRPERYAHDYAELIRAFVQGLQQTSSVFRRL